VWPPGGADAFIPLRRDDGSIALARATTGVRVPGLVVGDMPVDLAAAAIVQWLAKHLV